MEYLFLEILIEEAQKGNKPSNTFKAVPINRVAVAISERFQVQCDAHKKYEPFLNKSIDHYDEMALVVGKDMAIGSFVKTFADIDLDDGNQDSVPITAILLTTTMLEYGLSGNDDGGCMRKSKRGFGLYLDDFLPCCNEGETLNDGGGDFLRRQHNKGG
ncbi:hypothetical protein PVK06_001493 [Gossypium arboreum]|uniref:Uncharacterized protein n=1 Tax=Gossypium arboreum TaxID=29729 RepID=A0ABR0R187_GOSAR|nr:hypothetical protein PVK06_001493 [Gossypium arboreum]